MCLRIGVHVTDVIVDDHDIYGSGVNLAARIATLAGPGEIVVTAEVRDQLVPDLDVDIEDLGECYVKHISSPVRAYKVGGQVNPLRSSCEVLTEKALQLTVAVIPFVGRLLSPHHSAIGDLIADSVIVHLSRQIGVRVISRLSTAALRDRHEAVVQARERLGATYVLAGSFSVLDERLLVTAEVIDTRSSDVVWAERISVELRDLVQEESELAHRLCTGTLLSIQRTEVLRARTQPLPSLESFCLQLGAVALMHRASRNDFERVHALLEHLVERHPRLPTPRAWLAKWHVLRVTRGMASDLEAEARSALSHTQRAVDSDPQCALALAVEGFVYCHMRRDLATAEQRYDAALEANPNESIAWLFKSVLHAFRGQGATAVEAAKHAIELSPLDPLRYYYDSLAASAALSAGDYDAALRLASRSLRANRTHTSTLRVLVMAQALSGRIESAKASAGELLKLEPGFTVSGFLRRSPSAEFEIGRRCAEALRLAGISE
jgi:TolB-like protein/tetratricopeptide (TPR) repeat protein